MEIHTYKCQACQRRFAVLKAAKDVDEVKCPKCDSEEVEKVPSLFGANCSIFRPLGGG